jgi:DNA-binding response OmpR family regulator
MKVLVIEDEQRIASNIKKGLEFKAWTVDLAFDGETGLSLASSEPYDVIVLDRMLPKLSGMAVCQQLRLAGNSVPILMLTAKTEVQDRVDGLQSGADDYLGKPFAFSELLARLQALTRRPKKILPQILRYDSLELDQGTLTVKRKGKNISLSKREYTLLEFLIRHQGQILNKDQITLRVWSYESDVLPNIAQVYLGYLRKKIDLAFPKEKPLIHTLRGFGYRFGESKTL